MFIESFFEFGPQVPLLDLPSTLSVRILSKRASTGLAARFAVAPLNFLTSYPCQIRGKCRRQPLQTLTTLLNMVALSRYQNSVTVILDFAQGS
jgi:hypothetical protein